MLNVRKQHIDTDGSGSGKERGREVVTGVRSRRWESDFGAYDWGGSGGGK